MRHLESCFWPPSSRIINIYQRGFFSSWCFSKKFKKDSYERRPHLRGGELASITFVILELKLSTRSLTETRVWVEVEEEGVWMNDSLASSALHRWTFDQILLSSSLSGCRFSSSSDWRVNSVATSGEMWHRVLWCCVSEAAVWQGTPS